MHRPRFYVLCMASMPWRIEDDKTGKSFRTGSDLTRVVLDFHINNVDDFQEGIEPNSTIIFFANGRAYTVYIPFEEVYDLIHNQSTIDERYKEDVDSYKNDMLNVIRNFRNPNRETD